MAIDRIAPDGRRRLALALGLAALAGLGMAVATPVPQDRTALVLRLGRPVRVINGWGTGGAGLALRLPLVDQVVWLDRRLMTLTVDGAAVTTRDGQALAIDAYAAWRVTDPVRFFSALGNPDQAGEPVRAMLRAIVQQAVARGSLPDALALAHAADSGALRAAFDRELAGYGATVTDLRLSRVALPDGAPIEAAYARMSANAEAEAEATAEEGHRNAALIRAGAQARAGEIYAQSFGKDPQFYDFYRAMQSYDATFAQKGSHATMVLSPDNAYLRHFRGN